MRASRAGREGDQRDVQPLRLRLASTFIRCTAAVLAASWLRFEPGALGWLSARTLRASQQRSGPRLHATLDDLEDVVLVPMEQDYVRYEDFAPKPLPKFVEVEDSVPVGGAGKIVSKASKRTPLKPERALPADVLDKAASRMNIALKIGDDGTTPKSDKKRWLAGRGNAKRRKLEENANLIQWLVENGVWVSEKADWGRQASGVSVAIETREAVENEISGRGIVASRNINLYEELARVPVRLMFTKESSRTKFGQEVITDDMSEYTAIALQVISEKYHEKQSFWEPYLAVLPTTEEIGASFAWSEEDLDTLLAGSPLLKMSQVVRSFVHDEFRRLDSTLFEKHRDKFPAEAFTLTNYIWAYSILFSRAARLDFEDKKDIIGLVPYVDLINHQPSSQTYITGIRDGLELPFGVAEKENYIIVKADRYYNQYEQVYISYGPKSNAQLLMLYGFCLERNPGDFIEINLASLLDESPLAAAKMRSLADRGMNRTAFPLYRDRFTNEMMQFLRMVVIQPEDLNVQDISDEDSVERALSQFQLGSAYGELSERRALLCLKGICEELMAAYPTGIEDDEKLVQDRSMFELLPRNQRNALRVRYQEKVILRASMVTIDRVMNNLGSLTEMQQERARKQRANKDTFFGRLGMEVDPAIKATNLEELMKELDI